MTVLSMDKKAEIFESKLSQQDLVTLAYIVNRDMNKEFDLRLDKKVFALNQALETSIAAALFDYTDLTIAEVEEILKLSNEYMKGSEEFLIKYKEEWLMKINEVKPKIKEESIKLLDAAKNQQQAVKALGEIFKEVPTKDLVNIFKETKDEWCKRSTELTDEDRKIISEKGCIPHPENKVSMKEKVSSNAITPEKENEITTEQIDNSLNTFEVVEKKLKFKGEYYDYEKDKSGLKVGCEFFSSLEEIEAFRKRV